ncbi:MAG: hypothetical protein KGS61_19795, partial [Verrucomicrobia bacterium]|nr:hypothetical protein [Verrucomicrobiota bacterium]
MSADEQTGLASRVRIGQLSGGSGATAGDGRGVQASEAGVFATTHWSVVLAARQEGSPQATAALEQLCGDYWYPVYAYIRRRGARPEAAEDLTQEFFARLVAKDYLSAVRREKGRFRWFLLCAVKRFLINEREHARAAKRGGAVTHLPFDGAA